jgi:hypothetical protein
MPVRSRFRFAARDWGWPALIVAASCLLAAALNPMLAFAEPLPPAVAGQSEIN